MLDNVGCTGHRSEQAEIDLQYSNAASRMHLSMFPPCFCLFYSALKSQLKTMVCAQPALFKCQAVHLLLAGCARVCEV